MNDLVHILDESSIVSYSDLFGNITYANDKFCQISEYSRSELIGHNHRIVSSGFHNKEFFRNVWETISSGQVWKGEIKNKTKGQKYYWVFTTIIPLLDETGKIREYVSIRYDITQNKVIEEKVITNQKEILKSKVNQEASDKFINILTHDLRTPLTSAMLSAQMISRNINKPEVIERLTGKVLQNLQRADSMVTDLLNATKIRAGQKIALELNDCDGDIVVTKTLEELTSIYGSRFELVKEGDCRGRWSASGIKRIVENLCINAVKYGDQNAKIIVGLRSLNNHLEITVQNFGNILKDEEMTNLFDYLQRTSAAQDGSKKGWGLGLTLVKGMAESHGGVVDVSSKTAEGTIFKVNLPNNFFQNNCQLSTNDR